MKQIARGGMGDVYLATIKGIEGAERPYVVKTIRRDHCKNLTFLARFFDEARVQAQLSHSKVAQIFEAETHADGQPYTVVEYIEGKNLAEVKAKAAALHIHIHWTQAVAIGIDVAQALAYIHERLDADGKPLGIIHRDLSPQNIMVGYAGDVKLIDFGTARGKNRKCQTVSGVVFAKPGYVAPEIARCEIGDERIDIYALGVIIWELIHGDRIHFDNSKKHLEEVISGRFILPALTNERGCPKELDMILAKMTANKPEDRYWRARDIVDDLNQLLHLPSRANPANHPTVRAQIQGFMRELFPAEPVASRAEFYELISQSKKESTSSQLNITPTVSPVTLAKVKRIEQQMKDQTGLENEGEGQGLGKLEGTPYFLISKIGEGASGTVYEAEHTDLGRKLALKILSPALQTTADCVERFRDEAKAVAHVKHPNICYLHDFGTSLDGRIFLVMELLKGRTLAKYIEEKNKTGGFSIAEMIKLGMDLCLALGAAHAVGLVHRDIKPENLFVSEGLLKLLDFGVAIAKKDASAPSHRKPFALFGTPAYMSPEQIAGEPVDARADLYAMGCVFYEMLAGEPPFGDASGVLVMGKHLKQNPPLISARALARFPNRHVPDKLSCIIHKLLEKKPENRFQSAHEIYSELGKVLHLKRFFDTKRLQKMGGAFALVASGALSFALVSSLGQMKANRAWMDEVKRKDVMITLQKREPSTAFSTAQPPPAEDDLENKKPRSEEASSTWLYADDKPREPTSLPHEKDNLAAIRLNHLKKDPIGWSDDHKKPSGPIETIEKPENLSLVQASALKKITKPALQKVNARKNLK